MISAQQIGKPRSIGIPMDPRTKLLMVILTNICVITVVKTSVTLVALGIMIICFISIRRWKILILIAGAFAIFESISLISSLAPRWLGALISFFPAALEEIQAIWAAMQLRGLFTSATRAAAHPLRTTEYFIVPLVGSMLQISDDLSASAMT